MSIIRAGLFKYFQNRSDPPFCKQSVVSVKCASRVYLGRRRLQDVRGALKSALLGIVSCKRGVLGIRYRIKTLSLSERFCVYRASDR